MSERQRAIVFIVLASAGIALLGAAMLDYVAYEDFLEVLTWL